MTATDPAVLEPRAVPEPPASDLNGMAAGVPGAPAGAPPPSTPAAGSSGARGGARGPGHSPFQALINVVSSYGALFVSSLANILLTPVMLSTLGSEDYGILRVAYSLFGYLGLLDLGVSTSIIYFVARYHSAGDRRALDRYVSTVFQAIVLLVAAVTLLSVLAAPALAAFIGVPAGSEATGVAVIRASALMFAAHLIGGVFGGLLVGRGRYDVNNLISVGYLVANAVGTYAVLVAGYGVVAAVAVNAAVAVAGAAGRALAAGALRLATVTVGQVSGAVLRAIAGYGFWSFLNNIASQLSFATTDMIVLSRVLGVASVAVYSVALAPVALITSVVAQFVDVFQPVVTDLAYREGGDRGDVRRSFSLLMKSAVFIGWGLSLLLWLAGRQLLVAWVGDIGAQAGDLLIALTFAYGWNFVGKAAGLILLGTAKHQVLGVVAVAGAVLNLLLSLVLTMRVGLLGVAIGTIVVMGVTEMVILPVYTCRLVGLPLRSYLGLVVRAALSLLVAFGVGWGAGQATLEPLGGWGATAAACLAGGLVFLAAGWLVLLSAEERALMRTVARQLAHRRP